MRNFSIGFMSFAAVVAIAAIPTYISKNNITEASATDEVEIKQTVSEDEVDLLTSETEIYL